MKTLAILGGLCMAFSTMASEPYVELDFDEIVGNGPDHIEVEVNSYVLVDIWLLGNPHDGGLFVYSVTFCNYDRSLEFQGCEYFLLGPGWVGVPPTPGDCIIVQGADLQFADCMALPYLCATVTYRAVEDNSMAEVVGLTGGYDTCGWIGDLWSEIIGGTVQTGPTGTEESTWGMIKTMFR
ncbi:MAG: hypothetical protein ABIJ00_12700 [Candidatus Eisenbacteria bacterium]